MKEEPIQLIQQRAAVMRGELPDRREMDRLLPTARALRAKLVEASEDGFRMEPVREDRKLATSERAWLRRRGRGGTLPYCVELMHPGAWSQPATPCSFCEVASASKLDDSSA